MWFCGIGTRSDAASGGWPAELKYRARPRALRGGGGQKRSGSGGQGARAAAAADRERGCASPKRGLSPARSAACDPRLKPGARCASVDGECGRECVQGSTHRQPARAAAGGPAPRARCGRAATRARDSPTPDAWTACYHTACGSGEKEAGGATRTWTAEEESCVRASRRRRRFFLPTSTTLANPSLLPAGRQAHADAASLLRGRLDTKCPPHRPPHHPGRRRPCRRPLPCPTTPQPSRLGPVGARRPGLGGLRLGVVGRQGPRPLLVARPARHFRALAHLPLPGPSTRGTAAPTGTTR